MKEDQELARAKVRNPLNTILESVDFTLKPLGNPQITFKGCSYIHGLVSRKITHSRSSLEPFRLLGDEDGAREI